MKDHVLPFLETHHLTSQFMISALSDPQNVEKALLEQRLYLFSSNGTLDTVAFLSPANRLHLQGKFNAKLFSELPFLIKNHNLTSINGPKELMAEVERYLKIHNYKLARVTFNETVFQLFLKNYPPTPENSARFLSFSDFEGWHRLYVEYLKEMQISSSATMEDRRNRFKSEADRKMHWGVVVDKTLVAIGAFNSLTEKMAQVGGVFTDPVFRKRGLSEKIMKRLISDGKSIHRLEQIILYTGKTDVAPYNLYLKLGFEPVTEYWVLEY